MIGDKDNQKGFTLMEVLVVLAIFATLVVAVSDIFLISSRAQRKTQSKQILSGNARVAIETITKTVRQGTIDYARYGGVAPSESSTLYLLDSAGKEITFSLSSDPVKCPVSCILVGEDGIEAPLTPEAISVDKFKVFVYPDEDPYVRDPLSGTYSNNKSPMVTVYISLRNVGDPRDRGVVRVQTAVATRQYVR